MKVEVQRSNLKNNITAKHIKLGARTIKRSYKTRTIWPLRLFPLLVWFSLSVFSLAFALTSKTRDPESAAGQLAQGLVFLSRRASAFSEAREIVSLPSTLAGKLSPAVYFSSLAELKHRLSSFLQDQRLRRSEFSVTICWADSGEVIYEYQPHQSLIPASNMKLITTITALHRFGPDYQFITRVGFSGEDLVILGCGDPLFGDKETDKRMRRRAYWVLEDISGRLTNLSRSVINSILIDTSVFDQERVHPLWPKQALLQKYACEVSGLNYNNNCVEIAVKGQGKAVLFLEPKTSYVRLLNAVSVISTHENWFAVERTDKPGVLLVSGKVSSQAGPYAVAVANPALYFGTLLKEHLNKKGIRVEGGVKEEAFPTKRDFTLLAEYRTPLQEVLRRANKDSHGLAAEALLKLLGAWENPDHKAGSWEGGTKAVRAFLGALGLPENEFEVADGSGLCRENRLSSHVLASVLRWVYRQPFWPFYEATMAVGGIDGTLENVFREKTWRGRIIAKTGYINGVRALSGVTHTRYGDIIFSILANSASNLARTTINNVVKEVTRWADGLASASSEMK
ncbi:MAG: D-alanyl-D-alanine carboxypeptidase/D-alanyl-D-alanine endopeptidase [Candidatus Aminicenantales bacterium]